MNDLLSLLGGHQSSVPINNVNSSSLLALLGALRPGAQNVQYGRNKLTVPSNVVAPIFTNPQGIASLGFGR
jgi:hypothetical protein